MERTDTFMKRIDARLDTIDARLDTIDARLDQDKTFLNVYAARHHRIAPHWLPGIAA
jgi:hypothetical protein